jgi:outer membrane protein OmpA-like peptidoglycan-associated protein
VLTGHADWIGSARANQHIGLERAEAVRRLLADRGFDPAQLRVVSAGARAPIAPNTSAAGRAENRRVTISCSASSNPGGEL